MEGWKRVRSSADKEVYDRKWDGSRLTIFKSFEKWNVSFKLYENGMPILSEKMLLLNAPKNEAKNFAKIWMKKHRS